MLYKNQNGGEKVNIDPHNYEPAKGGMKRSKNDSVERSCHPYPGYSKGQGKHVGTQLKTTNPQFQYT